MCVPLVGVEDMFPWRDDDVRAAIPGRLFLVESGREAYVYVFGYLLG